MELEELRKRFNEFCNNNDFQLNPDQDHTDTALKGVLNNEKNTGLKYCPCQVRENDFSKDIRLLCPCNFKAQETWKTKDQCWCGLFIKK